MMGAGKRARCALVTFSLVASSVSALAAENTCECAKNQKASASAQGTCSVADLSAKCTITFEAGKAKSVALQEIEKQGYLNNLQFFKTGDGDPITQGLRFLNDPKEIVGPAVSDPAAFANTLFLALSPAIAQADPSALKSSLDLLQSNSQDVATTFTNFDVSSPKEINAISESRLFVQHGCVAIVNQAWQAFLKTSWSSASSTGCIPQ
ncbi:hypothetical protein [Mesorhizobium sp. B2-3-5]|uniref:hypothetical protein n=1 Tax=Mesorhizobium sp. B2-3-5 TaxID=2589958 RepID=UPI00112BE299|nr:hypothetical protein [Mesorhizobium sp. B2-3-5]TPM32953.1 hypothetical protein FJ958_09370 [Mesorhizobium sp. B2-3-5]